MRVAIIDTSVVVAGLLTRHLDVPTAQILDGMLSGAFPFVVSTPLLAEYRDVLNRPKLRKLHGLDADAVDALLTVLAENAIVLEPGAASPEPDPGDQLLWDLLACHENLCLVTGDALLLRTNDAPAPVLLPANFVATLLR
ncbi:MAG TPA: putative toxin-antitoxin system toxin component, PIN family [Rhodanobacteraceae bacterium]